MSMEYRTEDVINVLESEEPIEKLSDSIDLMQNFIYYSIDENSGGLSKKIMEIDDDQRMNCIKSLIDLYPFSANILKRIIAEFKVSDMKRNMLDWFDTSDVLYKMCNKFSTLFGDAADFSEEKTDLEESIADLERRKEALKEEKEKLQTIKEERKEVNDSVVQLDTEVSRLKAELDNYSDDAIKKKKSEIQKKTNELKRKKVEYDRKLKSYNDELKKYENGSNKEFDIAMKQLEKVISKLPKDEADK